MKLKVLLLAVFVAGIGASYALADNGRHHGDHNGCQEVHVRGTIAPQTLTVTSDGKGEHGSVPAGTPVTLQLGGTGQTVRVNVQACSTGTGTTTVLSVRNLELRVVNQEPSVTVGTTTTGHHGDDEHGDHHKGGTTTVSTTTAATTTAATTTAATTTAATTTGTTTTTP